MAEAILRQFLMRHFFYKTIVKSSFGYKTIPDVEAEKFFQLGESAQAFATRGHTHLYLHAITGDIHPAAPLVSEF